MCTKRNLLDDGFKDKASIIHHLDPRAKLLVTLFYIIMVMSFNKYHLGAISQFAFFPVLLIIMAEIPLLTVLKRIFFISIFACLVAGFNLFFDKSQIIVSHNFVITGGMLSFSSILLRFLLTASATIILLMTTGIRGTCLGLQKLGLPKSMVVQIFFLNRYISLLLDEATRLQQARLARSFGKKGLGIKTCGKILSSFILRTIDRAQRIYIAMKSRGFSGEIKSIEALNWHFFDSVYLFGWITIFTLLRFSNVNQILGNFILKAVQ